MVLVAFLLIGLGGVGLTFWFWFRTLHDEPGPAVVATAVTLAAFVVLAMVLLEMQASSGG